jgi:hypothetical protein
MKERCPNCWFKTDWGYMDDYLAMNRLYVKRYEKGKWRWQAIGWVCPNCGFVKLDAKFPLKHYRTVTTRVEAMNKSPAQYTEVPVMTAPAPSSASSKPTSLEPREYTDSEKAVRLMVKVKSVEGGREVEKKVKDLFKSFGYSLKEKEEESRVGSVVIKRRTIRADKDFLMYGFVGVTEDLYEDFVNIYISVYDEDVAKAVQELLKAEPKVEVKTI